MDYKTRLEIITEIQYWVKIYGIYPSAGNYMKYKCKKRGRFTFNFILKHFNEDWRGILKICGYDIKYFKKLRAKKCEWCGEVKYTTSLNKVTDTEFCSTSCGAKWRNKNLDRTKSQETKNKIAMSLRGKIRKPFANFKVKYCTCGSAFFNDNKYCSKFCSSKALSEKAIERTINGVVENKYKLGVMRYKDITLSCDSKLEFTSLIYLKDSLKAQNISRCRLKIDYIDDIGKQRKFNPDFECYINNIRHIIEVKHNPEHSKILRGYSRDINVKRKSLENYCRINNLSYIWLDLKYSNEFKKLYRDTLNNWGV